MKKILFIVFWTGAIFLTNLIIRFLFVEFFVGGYYWLAYLYIEVAVPIATLISVMLFFIIHYFIYKNRQRQASFMLSVKYFFLMLIISLFVFAGERVYFFLSDYFYYLKH